MGGREEVGGDWTVHMSMASFGASSSENKTSQWKGEKSTPMKESRGKMYLQDLFLTTKLTK